MWVGYFKNCCIVELLKCKQPDSSPSFKVIDPALVPDIHPISYAIMNIFLLRAVEEVIFTSAGLLHIHPHVRVSGGADGAL